MLIQLQRIYRLGFRLRLRNLIELKKQHDKLESEFQYIGMSVKLVPFDPKKSARLYKKAWKKFMKQKKELEIYGQANS